jgi:3-hydroxyacyl-[acyl-carrier-protein] dehydratase
MLNKGLYELSSLSFEKADNSVKAMVRFNKDHDIFKGHFPSIPVVPGVCMIQIMKEILSETIKKEIFLEKADEVKFINMVNPEVNPDIEIEIKIKNYDENNISINGIFYFRDLIFIKIRAGFKII